PPRAPFHTMPPWVRILIGLAFSMPSVGNAAPSVATLARMAARTAVPEKAPPLTIDASLAHAAEQHLGEVITDPKKARLDRVVAALRTEGLADAQVIPFTTLGTDPAALAEALERFAKSTVRSRGMTHVGVALVSKGDRFALEAIFSRRLVEVAPLSKK